MNLEHQLVCQGLENEHYEKQIVATEDIGTASYKASSLAKAFTEALKTSVTCFKGKKEGYLKGECSNSAPAKVLEAPSPNSICPQYLKGFHWKKHCHSKYDKDGKPLFAFKLQREQSSAQIIRGENHKILWVTNIFESTHPKPNKKKF